MARELDQTFLRDGYLYVPFNTAPLAAGPFLPDSLNRVDQHVKLPPEFLLLRHLESRVDQIRPAAAWVHGDSMIDIDVQDGDLAIFQRSRFSYVEHGNIVVIERIGDEEGFGSWALKKLVIKRPPSAARSDQQDDIDWEDPIIVLHSFNPRINPSQLDPTGRYRVHGIFLRSVRRHDVVLVPLDALNPS